MSTAVLPSYSHDHLLTLQQADPVLCDFLPFWRRNRGPDRRERQLKPVLELIRQWDRLVERDGLL